MIPWILRLKKANHKEIAAAQDIIVEELYKVFNNAILHGGTAIWRCYRGNRFSEDIDAYIPKGKEKIKVFFKNLEKRGLTVEKMKLADNSVYSNMRYNRIYVRFEATFQKFNGSLREYETTNGNLITVYTLTPEELIKEKVPTYLKRLKIRDLYDIFFLLRHVNKNEQITDSLSKLVKEFKPPVDKEDLKVIVLEGLVPTVEKMLEYIKGRVN